VQTLVMAGDPEAAFSLARERLARRPGDPALRKEMARIAAWSSHPREALDSLAWLARHGSEEARRNALTLARDLHDTDRVIEMLELKLRRVLKASRASARRPHRRVRPVQGDGQVTDAGPSAAGERLPWPRTGASAIARRELPRSSS
jgi:hypothetical protein